MGSGLGSQALPAISSACPKATKTFATRFGNVWKQFAEWFLKHLGDG